MQSDFRKRLLVFLCAGVLSWLLAFVISGVAPLAAGLVAGLLAPKRGAFGPAFLGALLSWLIWFGASAATAPLIPLAKVLGAVVGIGAGLGPILPLLAALFAGLIAGVGSAGVAGLLHPSPRRS